MNKSAKIITLTTAAILASISVISIIVVPVVVTQLQNGRQQEVFNVQKTSQWHEFVNQNFNNDSITPIKAQIIIDENESNWNSFFTAIDKNGLAIENAFNVDQIVVNKDRVLAKNPEIYISVTWNQGFFGGVTVVKQFISLLNSEANIEFVGGVEQASAVIQELIFSDNVAVDSAERITYVLSNVYYDSVFNLLDSSLAIDALNFLATSSLENSDWFSIAITVDLDANYTTTDSLNLPVIENIQGSKAIRVAWNDALETKNFIQTTFDNVSNPEPTIQDYVVAIEAIIPDLIASTNEANQIEDIFFTINQELDQTGQSLPTYEILFATKLKEGFTKVNSQSIEVVDLACISNLTIKLFEE